MTRKLTRGRERPTALLWAVVAELSLGGVLVLWLVTPGAVARAPFGPSVAVAIVVATLLGTAVAAMIVAATPDTSRALRWSVVLPLAVVAGGALAMAYGSFFAPQASLDVGIGVLLALGAIGADVTAWHVSRGRSRSPAVGGSA